MRERTTYGSAIIAGAPPQSSPPQRAGAPAPPPALGRPAPPESAPPALVLDAPLRPVLPPEPVLEAPPEPSADAPELPAAPGPPPSRSALPAQAHASEAIAIAARAAWIRGDFVTVTRVGLARARVKPPPDFDSKVRPRR
jgi:hypothetical protein